MWIFFSCNDKIKGGGMRGIRILTVATESCKAKHWYDSARRVGWSDDAIVILGEGQAWGGWAWRCRLLCDFMDTVAADEWVLFTDSYDLLVYGSPDDFLSLVVSRDCDVLISTEQLCFPETCDPVSGLRDRYVNAGCVIGRPQALKRVYKYISDNYTDDQKGWSAAINSGVVEKVCFDHDHVMCFNVNVGNIEKPGKSVHGVPFFQSLGFFMFPDSTFDMVRFEQQRQRQSGDGAFVAVPKFDDEGRPLCLHFPGSALDKYARYNLAVYMTLGAPTTGWYQYKWNIVCVIICFMLILLYVIARLGMRARRIRIAQQIK